jgi:hypothetical protein
VTKGRLEAFSDGVVAGILLAATGNRWPAFAVYSLVAMIWLVPDLRIARALEAGEG